MAADSAPPRVAVVGHIEWVRFASVDGVAAAGQIAHATGWFDEPAGGGAVAAVQLARLSGHALLISALGSDDLRERTLQRLEELGVTVRATARGERTRSAVAFTDPAGERAITTFGPRLAPSGTDHSLGWAQMNEVDGVYFTAGDRQALRRARSARVLVATARAGDDLRCGVPMDALVLSGRDELELRYAEHAGKHARLVICTDGANGGTWTDNDGGSGSWDAAPPPGPTVDSYGCGDSFAAGLTWALARGLALRSALDVAARCGAACLTGAGPYAGQLTGADL